MGNREMPPVADFVKIEPLTPEMVLEIGWLPQCEGISGKHCGSEPRFRIDGNFYCVTHKMVIVERWEVMIEEWVKRPARAQDSDLELLELIRDELKPPVIEPRFASASSPATPVTAPTWPTVSRTSSIISSRTTLSSTTPAGGSMSAAGWSAPASASTTRSRRTPPELLIRPTVLTLSRTPPERSREGTSPPSPKRPPIRSGMN